MRRTRIKCNKEIYFDILVDDVRDGVIASYILENRIWEPQETRFVSKLPLKGKTVVDIGANIGYYTLLCSKLIGINGKVYSFEPEDNNYSLLCRNINLNGLDNVTVENHAISDSSGYTSLYLSEHNQGDHRISYVAGRKHQIIRHQALDEYFDGIESEIHFIKSDTQGHEFEVLKGMSNIIQWNMDHLCCLLEFAPGLLTKNDDKGLEWYLELLASYPSIIYFVGDNNETHNLVRVDVQKLRIIAQYILANKEEDFSRDIVVFFNETAHDSYFKSMKLD